MYIFDDATLGLIGKIYGHGPVQGEGTVNGFPFYFRARWDEWTFSISENDKIDPVDIQFHAQGQKYGYFAEGKYRKESQYDASYMETATAVNIIKNCTKMYREQKRLNSSL